MFRRHGKTPIEWLHAIGALGDRTIIGHAIFLDHHPWIHWTTRNDLNLLRDAGATVAHCPTVFLRRGVALNTFGSYMRHGINMGIGTDTYPHNFLEELRSVLTVGRVVAGTVEDVSARDVFNAATIGGAHALRRDDIGKLCVGAKADLILVDITDPSMMPLREPIRSLIYVAADRAVRDVYVDGDRVVSDGKPVRIDYRAASEALQAAQKRSLAKVPTLDWAQREADELAPMVLGTSRD
jgi:cytosine/adenosine deaminase-related metal-dependent hydrolase